MIPKPSCVILDDEENALAFLRDSIEELNLLNIERAFLDPDDLLVEVDNLKSEIYFLDIEMAISGIEVAEKLKDKLVIFVSGGKDHTAEIFDVEALDFVPKPIRKSRLKMAIEKAINALKKDKSDIIVLKTQSYKKEELKYEDIVYIESSVRTDKKIFLFNGEEKIAKDIIWEKMQSKLSNDFLQVNNQNIVNLRYVNKLKSADLIVIDYNGKLKEFTLSDRYKESFFKEKPHLK